MIEVCFCIFQRPDRLPALLESLLRQTRQDFKVNIWNNSSVALDISSFPPERIRVINGKENIGSQARYRLVPHTEGNPIIFFDDDELLEPDFVQYNYEQFNHFGPRYILGWFTRIFPGSNYWDSISDSKYGTEVDYIGTGGMILDRSIFDKEETLQNIPAQFRKVEDLYLCYLAKMKYRMKLAAIEKKCSIIDDGKDQFGSLGTYKMKAFARLRSDGWKLIKDPLITRVFRWLYHKISRFLCFLWRLK